jgi:hypothetical protein
LDSARLLSRRVTAGRVAVRDIDHHDIAEPPVAHGCSRFHDDIRLAGATGDGDDIARHGVAGPIVTFPANWTTTC